MLVHLKHAEASWRSWKCAHTLPTNTARHRVSESPGNELPGWHIRSKLAEPEVRAYTANQHRSSPRF